MTTGISRAVALAASLAILATASAAAATTRRVSLGIDGEANFNSSRPSITSDGRYVAFDSHASNLVPGDDNSSADVFVHDTLTRTTVLASVSSFGTQGSLGGSSPQIAAGGRFVAFRSTSPDLVFGDTNLTLDIFVHDLARARTRRVSVASDGSESDDESGELAISASGRHVAFESQATNLVPNDTNDRRDIFVHDLATELTERVSVASDGTEADLSSCAPSISADGRFVAFDSDATNLVAGDDNFHPDVFVRDRATGATRRVSIAADGSQADHLSRSASISADGLRIAFVSRAANLVLDDTNGEEDVFVRDVASGTTRRISVASDGSEADAKANEPHISPDGRFVAFVSAATNLVPDDTNGETDTFVHDLVTGSTVRVSVAFDGTEADDASTKPSIALGAQFVAFESQATDLIPGDGNGFEDVFIRATSPISARFP